MLIMDHSQKMYELYQRLFHIFIMLQVSCEQTCTSDFTKKSNAIGTHTHTHFVYECKTANIQQELP